MFFTFSMIPLKADFTKISVEMLSAQAMENTEFASFQKSDEGFSGVGVGGAIGILALTVIHL